MPTEVLRVSDKIEKSAFAENMNTEFRVALDDSAGVELLLTDMREMQGAPRQEQFALTFRGPAETFLPQRTYRVEHERIGAFDLFLVPIDQDQEGFAYEAVFNRIIG